VILIKVIKVIRLYSMGSRVILYGVKGYIICVIIIKVIDII